MTENSTDLKKIRYRIEPLDDMESVQDRRERYLDYIDEMITVGNSTDILDTLLMFVNICETAPYRHTQTKEQLTWNTACAFSLRQVLKVMSNLTEEAPKPNIELEDQTLYYNDRYSLH